MVWRRVGGAIVKRAQGSGVAMVWKCRAIVAFSSQKGKVAEGWVSVLTAGFHLIEINIRRKEEIKV
jgi:hypothetical protein